MSTPLVVKTPDSNHTGHIAPGALVAIERLGPAELAVYEANASQSTRLESGLVQARLVESSRVEATRCVRRSSAQWPDPAGGGLRRRASLPATEGGGV